jgi:hypothetical protein
MRLSKQKYFDDDACPNLKVKETPWNKNLRTRVQYFHVSARGGHQRHERGSFSPHACLRLER